MKKQCECISLKQNVLFRSFGRFPKSNRTGSKNVKIVHRHYGFVPVSALCILVKAYTRVR